MPVRPGPWASGLSRHPVPATATGEVVGQLLDGLDRPPTLVLVAVTPAHGGALEDVVGALTALLGAPTVVGLVATAVGTGAEVDRPAAGIAALAGCAATPRLLPAGPGRPSLRLDGAAGALDIPTTRPVLSGRPARIVGGLDLGPDWRVVSVDGLVAVGPPMLVQASSGVAVATLDGRPAFEAVTAAARQHLPAPELRRMARQLRLRHDDGTVWQLQGADRATGALIGGPGPAPAPGTRVSLCVPRPEAAAGRALSAMASRPRTAAALAVLPPQESRAGRLGPDPDGDGPGPAPVPALAVTGSWADPHPGGGPGPAEPVVRVALFPSPDASGDGTGPPRSPDCEATDPD